MTKKTRRKFTGKEKVAILKQHLLEGKSVSDVCDAHGVNPTQFYRWQKEFFENGAAAFERTDKRTVQAQQRRQAELEAKLKKKDSVIAQIMEDLIAEKKDGLVELTFCLVHLLGGLIVADAHSDCIQLLEGNAGFEEVLDVGQ